MKFPLLGLHATAKRTDPLAARKARRKTKKTTGHAISELLAMGGECYELLRKDTVRLIGWNQLRVRHWKKGQDQRWKDGEEGHRDWRSY